MVVQCVSPQSAGVRCAEPACWKIDIDVMKEIYRISGSIPNGDWKQVTKAYAEEKWLPAVGNNASNALVVVMKPEDGIYMHCVGEAARGLGLHVGQKQFTAL